MKERINAVGSSIPERFALSAIAQVIENKGVFDAKFKGNAADGVEVELIVNGVSLSFTDVINDWYQRINSRREYEVRQAAMKMVSEAGLDQVAGALRHAELAITHAIEQVTYSAER